MSTEKSCKPENDISNRYIALIVATMASFFTPFMASAINIAIPSIGSEFAADVILLSWIPTVYLLAAAVLQCHLGELQIFMG